MATLTVSTKQSPFPFAAAAVAAYTQKAELVFDESAAGPTLVAAGSTITDEDSIVQFLAQETDLAGDSAKVNTAGCRFTFSLLIHVTHPVSDFFCFSKKSANTCCFS